jgi:hypothetical protein
MGHRLGGAGIMRIGVLAALMLLPVGCAAPPPEEVRREASVPAVPPLIRHAPNPVIHTTWTFRSSDEECVAVAAAAGTGLQVTIRRDTPVRLVVSLAAQPEHRSGTAPLRFAGPAGAWQVAARRTAARQFTVALGRDDTALSRILILLSGGMLDLGAPAQPIVSLAIGPSEAQGQTWFDCARGKML